MHLLQYQQINNRSKNACINIWMYGELINCTEVSIIRVLCILNSGNSLQFQHWMKIGPFTKWFVLLILLWNFPSADLFTETKNDILMHSKYGWFCCHFNSMRWFFLDDLFNFRFDYRFFVIARPCKLFVFGVCIIN